MDGAVQQVRGGMVGSALPGRRLDQRYQTAANPLAEKDIEDPSA